MKITQLLTFCTAAALFMAGCDNAKTDSTTTTTDTVSTVPVATVAQQAAIEGKSITVTTADVPDSVELSFTKKYPKVSNVTWVRYEPIESDYLDMDDTYYYVRFNNEGTDYTTWYNNRGEWVKTSTKVSGDPNLPDAVNKTINEQYPGYTIEEINKENDKDMEMYEIKLNKGEAKAKIKVLPNGEVFKRKS